MPYVEPRARPLLILAAVAAVLASAFAAAAVRTSTLMSATPHVGPPAYYRTGGSTLPDAAEPLNVLIVLAVPCALCFLALLWDGKRGESVVLTASMIGLAGFIIVSAASVGILFLPSAVLMLLALRRSMRAIAPQDFRDGLRHG